MRLERVAAGDVIKARIKGRSLAVQSVRHALDAVELARESLDPRHVVRAEVVGPVGTPEPHTSPELSLHLVDDHLQVPTTGAQLAKRAVGR
jgi:hypothetical protein